MYEVNQGNTKDMDISDRFEVYIPKEAEVTTILLRSLPNSLLKRIGLPFPVSKGSRQSSASPNCTWISPIVIRSKDNPRDNDTGDAAKKSMSSLVQSKPMAYQSPVHMPFVSENRIAYKLLSGVLPNARGLRNTKTDYTFPSPQNFPTCTNEDGVIIYCRRVYLSIKKVKGVTSKGLVNHPDSDASATHPPLRQRNSAPSASPESQKTASPELKDKEVEKKKRLLKRRVTSQDILPDNSPKKLNSLASKVATRTTGNMMVADQFTPVQGERWDGDISKSLGVSNIESGDGSTDIQKVKLLDSETKERFPVEQQACAVSSDECEAAVSPIIMPDDDDKELFNHRKADVVPHSDAQKHGTHDAFNNVNRMKNMYPLPFTSTAVLDYQELAKDEMIEILKNKLRESEAALNSLNHGSSA